MPPNSSFRPACQLEVRSEEQGAQEFLDARKNGGDERPDRVQIDLVSQVRLFRDVVAGDRVLYAFRALIRRGNTALASMFSASAVFSARTSLVFSAR